MMCWAVVVKAKEGAIPQWKNFYGIKKLDCFYA